MFDMLNVIYDGNCVICNGTKRTFSALDWRHQLNWVDLHDRARMKFISPNISEDRAMGQVHVLDGTTVYAGFFGTRRMMKALPLLYPLWFLLHIPGMTWLGQKVYRFIARNRYTINRLAGKPVCENDVCRIA
jgi:predicted DCC family thiol-disulfide oxidoreductase YuxK